MGTPDFSVPPLKALAAQKDFHISLVITQPDRPKGRGKKLAASPVKKAALELGLDVYQPEKLNTPEDLEKLRQLNPDFFVVAAFGQILSEKILDIPRIYPINIHASLLPRYRGSSPIQAAIKNMDQESGITTMVMDKGMDTGDILLTRSTPISPEDTAQDLHDRLSLIGADLIVETIRAVIDNKIIPTAQDHEKAVYVKLLKKNDGMIDWNQSSEEICAHIRAMNPWPGAFTCLDGHHTKIFCARLFDNTETLITNHAPGTIFQCDENGIHVSCGQGHLTILELMGRSGKRLKAADYLRGHAIHPPVQFEKLIRKK